MRPVSMNMRRSMEEQISSELAMFLFKFTHPRWGEPIRLSTDPSVKLSSNPFRYGSFSTWLTDDRSPFYFMIADALLPDDKEDAPASASMIFELLDSKILKLIRSTTDEVFVDMAVVRYASPNVTEYECQGLSLVGYDADVGRATLNLGRLRLKGEPSPAHRMNREFFPAMHR